MKLNDADKNIQVCNTFRLPSPTGKMGKYFPVRAKSGNFEQTGKVKEITQKLQKLGHFRQILFISS